MLSLGFLSNISPKASKAIAESLEGMQIDCVACCFLQAQYVKPYTAFQLHMFVYREDTAKQLSGMCFKRMFPF